MQNANGYILSDMSDVGRNLLANIYAQPLLDVVQKEWLIPSNVSQMGGRRQLGTNKVVPDLHIRPQLVTKKCGMCTSNHGPRDHLITQCSGDLIKIYCTI